MHSPRASRSQILLIAALVIAGACGGSGAAGTSHADAGDSPGSGADGLCGLANASEVGAALSIQGLEEPMVTSDATVTACDYALGDNPVKVIIRYEGPDSQADYERGKQGFADQQQSTTDVPGIGDAAFKSTLVSFGKEINSLVVYAKKTVLQITAGAPIDAEISLARSIIAKL